jgi:hypothetical protein
VFCGNGFSGNPELDVVQAFIDSRLGPANALSANPEAKRPFEFWFSSSAKVAPPNYKAHMRAVEKLVRGAVAASKKKMTAHFLSDGPLTIDLS